MPSVIPMSERELQTSTIDLARKLSWRVFHVHDSRRQISRRSGARFMVGDKDAKGFPDLTLVRERLLFAELKSDEGALTPEQQEWIDLLLGAGQEVYVWRPADLQEMAETLARRA